MKSFSKQFKDQFGNKYVPQNKIFELEDSPISTQSKAMGEYVSGSRKYFKDKYNQMCDSDEFFVDSELT